MFSPITIVDYLTIALWLILLVMKAFALGDAVMRPAEAFPAVDKQTKPLWLILTGLALLIHLIPQFGSPISLLNIAGTIAAAVYLVGVRPAVREVGGSRGGRGGRGGGPSGGW
ncbi:DUF2516 family protein [Actinopolymorpha singaporensis]|uniref:DUF2516 family protein n=1 Tax=Actinopolymorpha singaporensis TaxID=117157 RepID=A0A1H1LRE5_9ACTN|nr:DUF2516 family protein [Actinopolymorpha singaporensis]SDR77093.1 Protein of unknown function [Actinopolymorpha singaporensis]